MVFPRLFLWIINFAPFGIMGLVFDTVSNNGMSVFKEYGKLLMLLVGTMLLFISLPTRFLFSGVHTRIPTHLYSDV